MPASNSIDSLLGDLPGAFRNLFDAQMKLSADLFESLTGIPAPKVGDLAALGKRLVPGASKCGHDRGCCTIPPPCWMPRSLGECTSHVTACKSASLRFVVTNCDMARRTVAVLVTGADADKVTVSPTNVVLGPMERGAFTASVHVPDDAKNGDTYEVLIWIRGCKDYYFRWTISVGTAGFDSCHEVEVCDCPDYLHHWYDHFYCYRPCPHGNTRGIDDGVAGRG